MAHRKYISNGLLWILVIFAIIGFIWMNTYQQELRSVEALQAQLVTIQKRNNLFFRLLSENLHQVDIAYWQWDTETDEILWSPDIFTMFGLEDGPSTYDRWLETLHPADRQNADKIVRNSVADGVPYLIEYRIITPTGEIRRILESAAGDSTQKIMVGVCVLLDKPKIVLLDN